MQFSVEERALFWGLELHRRRASGLRKRLEQLPQEREEAERCLTEVRRVYDLALENKRSLELRQKKLELDVESIKERCNRHQQQLLNASDNREYTTLLKEIDKEKQHQDEIELTILEVMEELDKLSVLTVNNKQLYEKTENSTTKRLDELERESVNLKEKLDRCELKRKELLEGLSDAGRRMVEKLESQGLSGHICAEVRNYRCGVCGMEIATQALSEVRAGKMRQCESCSSMLYDEEQMSSSRTMARNRGYLPEDETQD